MNTPRRTEGWEERLAAYVESRQSAPFEWGVNDCCTFAAGARRELTGCDAMIRHASYTTALGAARVLRAAGGIERIPEIHGCIPQPLAMAQRGDVVSVEINGRVSLGVCMGAASLFQAPVGLSAVQTSRCSRAWRIN